MRRARHVDFQTVLGFTQDTFPGWGDYIGDVFADWVDATDGVFLAVTAGPGAETAEGTRIPAGQVIAVSRVAILTAAEAWLEGIRVDPLVRGLRIATDLQVAELRWAAAHGASVMRYLTGEQNEGSHRLGAKHGFALLGAARTYGWDHDMEPAPTVDESIVVASAPPAAIPTGSRPDGWWSALSADATVAGAHHLYEPRSWALQAFTRERLDEHIDAGDVLVWPPDAAQADGPGRGPWALAITRRVAEGEDDPGLPLSPALVAGDGIAVLELLRVIGGRRPGLPEVRLPDPVPPMLRGGVGDAWVAAGWRLRAHTTHIFERPIDAAHPVPEPDDPNLLVYEDEPRKVADPRRP